MAIQVLKKIKSSHAEVFYKKAILKIYEHSQENTRSMLLTLQADGCNLSASASSLLWFIQDCLYLDHLKRGFRP